jgi:hypothetical protein
MQRPHPATADVHYNPDEIEFMNAVQEYKRKSGHNFPTWSEVLSILKSLGYKKS